MYGGKTEGGYLSDLNILDLTTNSWTKYDTYGAKPTDRQWQASARHGSKIYFMGGCNYKSYTCSPGTYVLDADTLYWTILTDESR